jgi:hypothetical protein
MSPENCIVYVLTNEAMPNYIKIGTTRRLTTERMRDLYTSGVPVPFECHYAAEVNVELNVERRLHRAFDAFRVNKNREFFEMDPEAAADIIRMVAIRDATPSGEVYETPDDKDAIEKLEQKRAKRFSFKMVGIQPGSILSFKHDPDFTCTVVDNRNVEFEGSTLSLTAATLEVLVQRGFNWKSVQGAAYWTYGGKTLLDLREQLESED